MRTAEQMSLWKKTMEIQRCLLVKSSREFLKSLVIIFYLEHVKTKEIILKLIKIITAQP